MKRKTVILRYIGKSYKNKNSQEEFHVIDKDGKIIRFNEFLTALQAYINRL